VPALHAETYVYQPTHGSPYFPDPLYSPTYQGLAFEVGAPISVTSMGYWDFGRNGVVGSTITVSIFDRNTGTIVAGTQVGFTGDDGGFVGNYVIGSTDSGSYHAQLRVQTLSAPVALASGGSYLLLASGYDDNNAYVYTGDAHANFFDSFNGALTFSGSYYGWTTDDLRLSSSYSNRGIGTLGVITTPAAPWTGGASTSDWFTAGNWQSGAVNAANDTLQSGFINIAAAGATSTNFTIALDNGTTGLVRVAGPAATWSVASALQVGVGGAGVLEIADGGTVTVGGGSGTLKVGAGSSLVFGNGETTGTLLAGGVELTTATSALVFSATDASSTFSVPVSGLGGITKTGAGTLTLAAANTFSGTTLVSTGTLNLIHPEALQNSTLHLASGTTMTFGANAAYVIGSLSGSGTVDYGAPSHSPYFQPRGLSVGGNNASTTFSGNITGDGLYMGLTKVGTGNFTFTGGNARMPISVESGTLTLAPAQGSNIHGNVIVGNGAALNIAPADATALDLYRISVRTGGTLHVADNVSTTALTTTDVNLEGGTLLMAGTDLVLGGLSSAYGSPASTIGTPSLGTGRTVTIGANNVSSILYAPLQAASGNFVAIYKIGTGTWTMGSTLSGITPYIQGGYAVMVSGGETNRINLNGGGLRYGQALTHTERISVQAGGGTVDTGANDVTHSGDFEGTGTLTKIGSGTLTLSGPGTSFQYGFNGTLAINAGTVAINAEGKLGNITPDYYGSPYPTVSLAFGGGALRTTASFAATRPTTLNAGGGTFNTDAGTTLAWNGGISGTGALTKTGAGTLVLGGTNTYSGLTTISAGKLKINGIAATSAFTVSSGTTLGGSGTIGALTLASGGTLAAGNSPGILTASNTTFASGSHIEFEINNAVGTAGTNWDQLAVDGTLTLAPGATIFIDAVSLLGDNSPGLLAGVQSGQTYTWSLATTTGGIIGFNTATFSMNTDQFLTSIGGIFSVGLGNNGGAGGTNSSLDLIFTTAGAIPEPSTYAAFAGLGVLAFTIARRRK
jgi:fibronectin-binding autotransporter adhesin